MKCYKIRAEGRKDVFYATNRSDIWMTAGGAKRALGEMKKYGADRYIVHPTGKETAEWDWDRWQEYHRSNEGLVPEVVEYDMVEVKKDPWEREPGVDEILNFYKKYINATPPLLSLLYDVDLLPEQIVSRHAAISMAAICDVWKGGVEGVLPK